MPLPDNNLTVTGDSRSAAVEVTAWQITQSHHRSILPPKCFACLTIGDRKAIPGYDGTIRGGAGRHAVVGSPRQIAEPDKARGGSPSERLRPALTRLQPTTTFPSADTPLAAASCVPPGRTPRLVITPLCHLKGSGPCPAVPCPTITEPLLDTALATLPNDPPARSPNPINPPGAVHLAASLPLAE